MSSVRAVLKAVTTVDQSRIERSLVIRCGVGVAIPLVCAYFAGNLDYGLAAAAGAVCVCFASQQGFYRTRAIVMLWTAIGMALSSFVGGVSGEYTPALIVVAALWGYLCAIIGGLGPAATAAAVNSVVALAIFSELHLSIVSTAEQSVLVLGGGLLQTLLVVGIWPLQRFTAERRALAGAYRDLAAYARTLELDEMTLPATANLRTMRETLSDPQPFARRGDIAVFQSLLDEAERIRASLAALVIDRHSLEEASERDVAAAIATLGGGCVAPLEAIAAALVQGRAPGEIPPTWAAAESAAKRLAEADGGLSHHAATVGRALIGQVRAAWRTAQVPAGNEVTDLDVTMTRRRIIPRFDDTFVTLRTSFSLRSPVGRHALRLAVTMALAVYIERAFHLHHGYWVPMTAVIVLRPDFTTTFSRGIARVVGTMIGAALATAIVAFLHVDPLITIVLTVSFATLAAVFFAANYALFTIAITAYVVFLLSGVGIPEPSAVGDRILATLIGGLLPGLIYFVWPTWEARRVGIVLADLLEADRAYAKVLFDAYTDPNRRDPEAIASAQQAAWIARANAEASVDRMLTEPGRTHGRQSQRALGLLAASRRLGLGLLTLNAHLDGAAAVVRPQLESFYGALDRAMTAEINALREATVPPTHPPLRDAYRAVEASFVAGADPDGDLLLAESDLLIDSVNTVEEILGARHAVAGLPAS